MFSDIRVLIAENDVQQARVLRRTLEAMTFCVETVDEGVVGLGKIASSDILIVNLDLANGQANSLLERWAAQNRGPVCVLETGSNNDREEELFTCGAWNIVHQHKIGIVQIIARRYAQTILDHRERLKQAAQIKQLRKAVIALGIAVVAIGGSELVPTLAKWLSTFL